MPAAADGLSADMAHKAHIKALNRDYILEPRLGNHLQALKEQHFAQPHPSCTVNDVVMREFFVFADYRTIGGVSGPLVIVEYVKVFLRSIHLEDDGCTICIPCQRQNLLKPTLQSCDSSNKPQAWSDLSVCTGR